MRRYVYRCSVCRTTSPVLFDLPDLADEGQAHRLALHGGHIPDEEIAGQIDRLGRWYAALSPLVALHARIADGLSDLHNEKTMGHYWWASIGAVLILAASAALVVAVFALAL
ncbi:hypothetical protein [Streptomyces sp. NPDC051561]|uniref:hypothetical protein n=1 Tax=Streptomyces sp. NPDC051561 TaxID=3365658 RepID=UPI0037B09B7C